MTIVNNAISWSITLEPSITLLESSMMLPENSTGINHDDIMFIVQAIGLFFKIMFVIHQFYF